MSPMVLTTPGIVAAAIMVSGSVILIAANKFMWVVPPQRGKGKKKVRFSDTVVEPKGDSREFRRFHMKRMMMNSALTSDCPASISGAESMDGVGGQDSQRESTVEGSGKKASSSKVKALIGGNIPANRMALYCNMYRDRLLKA